MIPSAAYRRRESARAREARHNRLPRWRRRTGRCALGYTPPLWCRYDRRLHRGQPIHRDAKGRPMHARCAELAADVVGPVIRIKEPMWLMHPDRMPSLPTEAGATDGETGRCWRCDAAPATEEVGLCGTCHRDLTAG